MLLGWAGLGWRRFQRGITPSQDAHGRGLGLHALLLILLLFSASNDPWGGFVGRS